ncbi:MAG: BTAD domain-containing putative transcriptional regulator, partial [Nocardioidaceae bacterium]
MYRLEIRMLGPFVVTVDGEPAVIPAGRERALLASLALSAGVEVSIDQLVDMVWGERPPSHARRAVQTNVKRLRAALGRDTIRTTGTGYALATDSIRIDTIRFDALLDAAAAEPCGERDRLAEALDLWRGTPLDGVDSQWLAETERPRLVELYLSALERRIELDTAAGQAATTVADAREVAGRHPLRESLWALVIAALDKAGGPAEALECYETVRRRIADELGVDPGPELQRLHAGLLQKTPPGAPASDTETASLDRVVPRELPVDPSSFTGREDMLGALDAMLGTAPQPMVVALHGPGGIGKTTIAVHWAHRVADRFSDGQLYVDLQGFGPGEPLTPAAAQAALLGGLGVPGDRLPPDPETRGALLRTTLAGRRVLMVLDNAREADQVRPLLPGAGASMVIVTSRSRLRGLAAREGADRLQVESLPLPDATALLAAGLDRRGIPYERSELSELAELCSRLPLALAVAVEQAGRHADARLTDLVSELRDERARLDALGTANDPLSDVRAVLSWSYQALDHDTARAFRFLGLHLGTDIGLPAAAALFGERPRTTRRLLERLADVHLVNSVRPGRRYTMHDLVRSYATELADDEAQTIREGTRRRQICWYVHSASRADPRLSFDGHVSALDMGALEPGVEPASFADYGQARDWYDAEWPTLVRVVRHAVDDNDPRTVYRLVSRSFNYLYKYRSPVEAVELQEAARVAAEAVGGSTELATVTNQLGVSYARQGDYERCIALMEQAAALLTDEPDPRREANVLMNLGVAYSSIGRLGDARQALERALALRAGDESGDAWVRILENLADVHLRDGRPDDAIETADKALADLRGNTDRRQSEASVRRTVGPAYAARGDTAQAERHLHRALAIYRELGNRWDEALTLGELGRIRRDEGRTDDARASWREALAIVDEVGDLDATELTSVELLELLD